MNKLIAIPITEVARHCGIWIKHNAADTEIRCRCPFCGGQKNKSTVNINVIKNVFYCHRCGESHNSITLYAKLIGVDNRQAYRDLAEIMNDKAA